ncbi:MULTISPECIES: replication initiator [unclassified Phycicoccus]|uniref:replication initiator n=1 Tax=unclassified Phycicoccus TaxID=2637926 RepID=UPI0019100F88|nr:MULTISPECIES: replication initiator [unclassified Phycicoccus]
MTSTTRNQVWTALPPIGDRDDRPLDLPQLDAATQAQVVARLLSPDFDAWSVAASRVGFCAKPIRLVGQSRTFDKTTGELVRCYASADEPTGVTFVRCGNRRASECESCSRLYAADTFHLIRSGVTGGKGVPATVGENPLVFATLTAPSFGPVHGVRPNNGRCRPRRDTGARCPHGRPLSCMAIHADEDIAVGQPLCPDCYDYASQVVWQWWAPELWRRFTITLRRMLAHHVGVLPAHLGDVASVQYAKVAEYQLRGAVHFHALVRLDGPQTTDGFAHAPTQVTARVLSALVEQAVRAVRVTADPVHDGDVPRVLALGVQVDTRPVRTSSRTDDPDRELTPEQVAGYLAKYATKSASDTEAKDSTHLRRLHATARSMAARAVSAEEDPTAPYGLLGKWAHTLGFRGHFATKSRRYSVTLGALRRARQRAQARIVEANRTGTPIDLRAIEAELLADVEDEATVVIGSWAYAGTGWANDGETALATAAASRAREYAQERARIRSEHNRNRLRGNTDDSSKIFTGR